jgi:hypothetical protein
MLKANFCFIAGFCSINVLMKSEKWRKKGDDLALFPDFNKEEDVEVVKKKVLPYPETFQRKLDESPDAPHRDLYKLIVKRSTAMMEVLSKISKSRDKNDKNKCLMLKREFWLGHDFIFYEHKNFCRENAFIFFDGINENEGFNLMVHPFENKSTNEKPSGGINSEGLKTLLSKPTPVTISDSGHYFLAEIEGIITNIIYMLRFITKLMLI